MPQFEVGEFWSCSLLDLYGWDSVPDLPPVKRARMYYNESNNTVHVIDSNGAELLSVNNVNSVFGRVGTITAQAEDYAAFYVPSVFGRTGAITAQIQDYAALGEVKTIISKSSTYVTAENDFIILCTGTFVLTLSSTNAIAGQMYRVKNMSTGTITLTPSSGTIDGASSVTLGTQYQTYDVVFDGVNWEIF